MKRRNILILMLLLTFSHIAKSQVYEHIYAVSDEMVQQKMDENKRSGVAILTGIQAHHIIGITNIHTQQISQIENQLKSNPRIQTLEISEDAKAIIIDSEATITEEFLKELIAQSGGVVTGYTVQYTVQ